MPFDKLSAVRAVHTSWAKTPDPSQRARRTRAGRAAADERFVKQARELLGPDASESNVARSAAHLRKAWYAELAMKSAAARRAA